MIERIQPVPRLVGAATMPQQVNSAHGASNEAVGPNSCNASQFGSASVPKPATHQHSGASSNISPGRTTGSSTQASRANQL